jgi:hypothetical protein
VKLDAMPVHASGIVSRLIDGEAVLVHPRQGKVRVLNRVGARVWELADGAHTVSDLAQAITGQYDVDLERAQADVTAFCDDLVARGLFDLAE